jgi:hypothetical protein
MLDVRPALDSADAVWDRMKVKTKPQKLISISNFKKFHLVFQNSTFTSQVAWWRWRYASQVESLEGNQQAVQ